MPILLRFVATILGASVFFFLAVLGWGGLLPFFSHPALVVLTVLSLIIVVVALFAGGNISAGEREDRGNRWVLAAFGVISMAIGFFPAYTDRLGIWTLDGDAIRWAGVVVYVAGCILRILPVYVLGSRFSGLVAIQPGPTSWSPLASTAGSAIPAIWAWRSQCWAGHSPFVRWSDCCWVRRSCRY